MTVIVDHEIKSMIKEARALEASVGKLAQRLEAVLAGASETEPSTNIYKRPSGHLTDFGVAKMEEAFEAGEAVMAIAERFGVGHGAVSQRKASWQKAKGKLGK